MLTVSRGERLFALVALVPLIALVGCGRDDSKQPASQVAAKVNKSEITVHQLNAQLSQLRNLSADQQKQATKQVLERMIDQELLVQKAMERKLDRDPRVLQALEASRRQILAQAYLDQLSQQAARPTAEEIKKFYAERPELFAERRVFRLQELAIPSRDGLSAQSLEEAIKGAKTMNDVVAWLQSKSIPFNANATVKTAEQLPLEMLPRLARLSPGQVMLMPAQQGFLLVQVVAVEKQPLDERQAQPLIEQFLANQRRLELAQGEVRTLRSGAKIEYIGEFAAAAPAASPAPEPGRAGANAATEKSPIDKGVAGLR